MIWGMVFLVMLAAPCAAVERTFQTTVAHEAALADEAAQRSETVEQAFERLVATAFAQVLRDQESRRSRRLQRQFETATEAEKLAAERALNLRP